jgi:hypothetical protein
MWHGSAPGSFDAAQDAQAYEAHRTLFAGERLCKIN